MHKTLQLRRDIVLVWSHAWVAAFNTFSPIRREHLAVAYRLLPRRRAKRVLSMMRRFLR